MICISISQESRRLGLADMLNAKMLGGDLLEVRLDCFREAPDVNKLLSVRPKPVIMSCRRVQDGGHWQGTEEERLALLRQCIVDKADYVEIELDVADQIRPFPPSKRVISYTNLRETPPDIADIHAQARAKKADVIKLVTLAMPPERAWPLVQLLARATTPTVVVGLGKPGVMLSVLGKKIGAPWTYAALERGMESYPGQATIHDLEQVYHYRAIDRATRLIGVTGFTDLEYLTVALLNAALAHLGFNARCLPLIVGSVPLFRKVMDAVRLAGVVVDEGHRGAVVDIVEELEPAARQVQAADLLLHKDEKWHGYNLLCRAAVAALETALKIRVQADKPLQGRMAMIVGTNPTARAMAFAIQRRGGLPIIASHDRDAAHQLAQVFGCRHVQFEAIYSTTHDVLVVCSDEKEQLPAKARSGEAGIHAGYLKPGMAVMDLTALPRKSALLREAEARGCTVAAPREILLDQVELLVRLIAGKDVPREQLTEALTATLGDEE
jgi:3-dehydroquinate dehydratase/shikimate dehydrogenase